MANFDGAHFFVKDMMEIPIFNVIKQLNDSDAYLKLIISGGDVLNRYFMGPQIFFTHDFDIKLTANQEVVLTDSNVDAMYKYAVEVSEAMEDTLNNFYLKNKQRIDNLLAKNYKVKMSKKRYTGKYFNALRVEGRAHIPIRSQLRTLDDKEQDVDEIIDLWVALPDTLTFPYNTFLGGDPKLSLDGSKYFIPTIEMEGMLIAGLGYMLWDTQRMIDYSADLERKGKVNKLQRYIDKQKAMYNDLNHPLKRLSCLPFEDYIKHCDKKIKKCSIGNRHFKTVEQALSFAQNEGYLSSSQAKEIRDGKYTLSYICVYINKLKEYYSE